MRFGRLNIVRALLSGHSSDLELLPQQDSVLFRASVDGQLLGPGDHLNAEGRPLAVAPLRDVDHVILHLVDVFEDSDDFSRTHENFKGLQLAQLIEGFDAALRTDHHVAVCGRLPTHFGEDVLATEKDMLGRDGHLVVVELVRVLLLGLYG